MHTKAHIRITLLRIAMSQNIPSSTYQTFRTMIALFRLRIMLAFFHRQFLPRLDCVAARFDHATVSNLVRGPCLVDLVHIAFVATQDDREVLDFFEQSCDAHVAASSMHFCDSRACIVGTQGIGRFRLSLENGVLDRFMCFSEWRETEIVHSHVCSLFCGQRRTVNDVYAHVDAAAPLGVPGGIVR
jgi:hypothetical protein